MFFPGFTPAARVVLHKTSIMSKRLQLRADMQANGTYHVFNRTNNKEVLFRDDEDHLFFLHCYNRFLAGYLSTYAWALLPNHFHFVVSVADEPAIRSLLRKLPAETLTYLEQQFLLRKIDIHQLVRLQWTRAFIAYSAYFNRKYNRKGNLFFRSFKRKAIADKAQLRDTILYVHLNPVKHGLIESWQQYLWTSWKTITRQNYKPVALHLDQLFQVFRSRLMLEQQHTAYAEQWQWQPAFAS